MSKKKEFKGVELFKVSPDVLSRVRMDSFVGNSTDGAVNLMGRGSKRKLIVTAPATHAGRLTANLGLYQPRKMKDQIESFIKPFKKPVLVGHDERNDPIGRVIGVGYEPISYDFLSKPADQMDEQETFDLIRMLMKTGMLYDDSFKGLGSGILSLEITDKDAIEKFLDERYLTLSIRVGTDEVFDPHTGKPFMDLWTYIENDGDPGEEYSPHRPGDIVDGMLTFSVLNNLFYREVSPVNIPADEEAIVSSMQEVFVKDSKNKNAVNSRLVDEIDGAFDISDSIVVANSSIEVRDNEQDKQKEKKNMGKKEKISAFDSVILYKRITDVIDSEYKDLKTKTLSESEVAELSGKEFCGPSRTFPILDEAHYKASLDVLDEMDIDEERKDRIRKQIVRKADKLGLLLDPTVKDANKVVEKLDSLSDYDFSEFADKVLAEFKSRGFSISDSAVLSSIVGSGSPDSAEVEDMKAKLSALEAENKALISDCKKSNALCKVLGDVFVDSLKVESLEDKLEEVVSLDLKELQDSVSSFLSDKKLEERIKMYLDGFQKEADGKHEIEDETLTSEEVAKQESSPTGINLIVKERYIQVRDNFGEEQAKDYLDSMAAYVDPELIAELTAKEGE